MSNEDVDNNYKQTSNIKLGSASKVKAHEDQIDKESDSNSSDREGQ